MVTRENKAGSRLDVNGCPGDTMNQGVFDDRKSTEEMAKLWRDEMPG